MTSLSITLLVLGILAVQVLIWIPILAWLRRMNTRALAALGAELDATGERRVLGPVAINYRGSTEHPAIKGNAVAALTDRRLVIRKLVGADLEIPVDDIVGVRDDKWFVRAYAAGRPIVIVKNKDGNEVGLLVADHDAWMTALRALIARP